MRTKPSLLLHPLFLVSLTLLLLNDFYLKYEYHNWLTGKVSDFTGLFVFAVFLISFFPPYKKTIILFSALFFCWWKSPLSDTFICFLKMELNIAVSRILDYSDLLALIILPASLFLNPVKYKETGLRKLLVGIIAVISLTAFTATSLPIKLADNNKIQLDKYISTKKDERAIIKKLSEKGLNPKKDTIYQKVWERYYLKPKDTSKAMVLADSAYSGIYKKIDYGSSYVIPKMYIVGDSISNLQFVIYDFSHGKTDIWLHSFEYKIGLSDTVFHHSSAYYIWRKLKNPIKRKFKEIIEN